MLRYNPKLTPIARRLRKNLTESEKRLWSRFRGKQLLDIQFYRQKPIGDYIVDFYAPKVKLIIEIDGSQHLESNHVLRDRERDHFLSLSGYHVLRFDSSQVMKKTDAVIQAIYEIATQRIKR